MKIEATTTVVNAIKLPVRRICIKGALALLWFSNLTDGRALFNFT